MTTINPNTPTIPNAIEFDLVINNVQTALSSILWIEKSFNRATIHNDPVKGLTPKAYQGGGKYFDVLHNGAIKAHSFFYSDSIENSLEYEAGQKGYKERDLILFVLGDLKKIDSSKDYIFTTELKREVEDVLSQFQEIEVNGVYDSDPNIIFSDFEINDKHRQLLMYPKFALRFNLTATYEEYCGNGFIGDELEYDLQYNL